MKLDPFEQVRNAVRGAIAAIEKNSPERPPEKAAEKPAEQKALNAQKLVDRFHEQALRDASSAENRRRRKIAKVKEARMHRRNSQRYLEPEVDVLVLSAGQKLAPRPNLSLHGGDC
jgi:hypothetical protein